MANVNNDANDERRRQFYSVIEMMDSSLSRYESIRDPKIKSIMLLDKLSTILDLIVSHNYISSRHLSEELNERYNNCIRRIRNEIRATMQWTQDVNSPPNLNFATSPPPTKL